MKTTLEQVQEFHETFNHPVNDKPHIHDDKLNDLRVNLIREELNELTVGLANRDEVEVLDALLDIQYVLDGAFLALGFHKMKDEAFAEVQSSNMSKLGADGKPIYREDGKVLKGPNYFKADLQQFVEKLYTMEEPIQSRHGEKFDRDAKSCGLVVDDTDQCEGCQ